MAPSSNLVLVHTDSWQSLADFVEIKARIEAKAPDIEVFIASNLTRSSYTRKKAARRPSLIFSPNRLLAFRPDRGKICVGKPMSKLTEMSRLVAAGIPVPTFEEIRPETILSSEIYGPYVIVKPTHELASWGQGIELLRTESVRYRAFSDYPADHPGRHAPMLAQKFIDCGHAMTCRVLTLFGVPLLTYCRESTKPLALDACIEPFQQPDFMPAPPDLIAYTTRDPAMLALAYAAYCAMPEIPLQACDILRAKNGNLYLLEINPGGGTWMFSNASANAYKAGLGIDDLTSEFDAFATCARLLIDRTRAEAI